MENQKSFHFSSESTKGPLGEPNALSLKSTKQSFSELNALLLESTDGAFVESNVPLHESVKRARPKTKSSDSSKQLRNIPREGGMEGEFQRLMEKGGPGITESMHLYTTEEGDTIEVKPSSDMSQYTAIDSRRLRRMSMSDTDREVSELSPLLNKIFNGLRATSADKLLSDVGDVPGWLRKIGSGYLPCPPAQQHAILSKRTGKDNAAASVLRVLESTFCDNFQVQSIPAPGLSDKGKPRTARNTVDDLLKKGFGWESGASADKCQNKYYLQMNATKQSEIEAGKGQKWLVKVADITLAEIDAVSDIIRTVKESPWDEELVKEVRNQAVVGQLFEILRGRNPHAKIWTNENANIQWAMTHAAKYVTWYDEDNTRDLAGTLNVPKFTRLLCQKDYDIAPPTTGINCVKTKVQCVSGGLSFNIMGYNKVYETLQQPGKSKQKTLDCKASYVANATTLGLSQRSSNTEYQSKGIARLEITFADSSTSKWNRVEKDKLMDSIEVLMRKSMVIKSIHDHLADMESCIHVTQALFAPQVHEMKRKALKSRDKKGRKIDKSWINIAPEGLVRYWSNRETSKSVGRVIQSDVHVAGASCNGFKKFCLALATESPCNTRIVMDVVVGGFDSYMKGDLPVIWTRRIELEKFSTSTQDSDLLMYVSPNVCEKSGAGALTNMPLACGVHSQYLEKLKMAVTTTQPAHNTLHLNIRMKGGGGGDASPLLPITQNSFPKGCVEGLPSELTKVKVFEDRKGTMGRPSKTKQLPVAFQYLGDTFKFPPGSQGEVLEWFNQQIRNKECWAKVRYTKEKGFEYSFDDDTDHSDRFIHGRAKLASDLPVEAKPMKIQKLIRKKQGRGVRFEIDLVAGRYKAPVTVLKKFVQYLREQGDADANLVKGQEPFELPLAEKGYYILHPEQKRGHVQGGKADDEEWIQIVRDDQQHCQEVILKSEPTSSAKAKAVGKRKKGQNDGLEEQDEQCSKWARHQ